MKTRVVRFSSRLEFENNLNLNLDELTGMSCSIVDVKFEVLIDRDGDFIYFGLITYKERD